MERCVKPITYEDTKPFLLKVHYARRMPCIKYAFGLFIDNELKGCVTYGTPASPTLCRGVAGPENKGKVLELNRLVICDDTKNNASFLVGRSLRMLPKGLFVVSYSDAGGWGHVGYVYQATNWLYTGMTRPRTDIYSAGKHPRHSQEDITKRQIRTAKHRYIYLTGNKKEQLKQLRYPVIKDYPKGDSVRYNTDNPVPVNNMLGKLIERKGCLDEKNN